MKFYQHWIGDYQKATRRLSMLEHGAYRLLLDEYYSTETPLPANAMQLHRICMAFAYEEQEAVHSVLDKFFTLTDEGYIHDRVEDEIEKSHKKSKKRSFAAKKRWNDNANADANADAIAIHKSQPQPQPYKTLKPVAVEPTTELVNRGGCEPVVGAETQQQQQLREVILTNRATLLKVSPVDDDGFDGVMETCVAHYRSKRIGVDPLATALKWFRNERCRSPDSAPPVDGMSQMAKGMAVLSAMRGRSVSGFEVDSKRGSGRGGAALQLEAAELPTCGDVAENGGGMAEVVDAEIVKSSTGG